MRTDDRRAIPEHEPTLRMPAPGGQATVIMKRAPTHAAAPSAGMELQRLVAGINPLLGAAATLLALLEQLRNTPAHDDPVGLRGQLLEQIAAFEAVAGASGVPRPKVTAARYLLCSFIDEVIAQTPWGAGAQSGSGRSLLQEFHDEPSGGDKAFELLERLGEDAAANTDLLELFYICLRLGFEGRYRGVPQGRTQLDAIAARLLEVIRPAAQAAVARQLSVHSQGVRTPGHRDRVVLPLWVVGALPAGLLLGLFLFVIGRLDALAQPVFRQIHALPMALRIAPAAPAEAATRPRLVPLLQAEIGRGALQVRDEAQRSVVTLSADALFVPGSAQIQADQLEVLRHVAAALKGSPGQIAVIGHTDNAAVSSLQFPSNWHLSHERARAVLARLEQQGAPAERLRAEGRADVEPLVANGSPAQRARNRRIEIELRLPRPDG